MGVNSPYLRLYRETTGSATLYVHFSVFCHTDFGSVVRSSVCHLRLDLLEKIVPSGLWLKALVHHAALTAYHKDSHAKAAPEDAHASSATCPVGSAPSRPLFALHLGVSLCLSPPRLRSTPSASASTPHATSTASPFSGLTGNSPPSPSLSWKTTTAIKPSSYASNNCTSSTPRPTSR